MKIKGFVSHGLHGLRVGAASLAVLQMSVGQVLAAGPVPAPGGSDRSAFTATPIKHVIVIIGENRSFDHVFATYVPRPGQTVNNLLSEGIIQLDANKNAIPGPNFRKAQQLSATDLGSQDSFLLSPPKQEFSNNRLPVPEVGGPEYAQGYFTTKACRNATGATEVTCAANALTLAQNTETGLPDAPDANGLSYYQSLVSGGT